MPEPDIETYKQAYEGVVALLRMEYPDNRTMLDIINIWGDLLTPEQRAAIESIEAQET